MFSKGVRWALATAVISGISIFANKFGVAGFNPAHFTFTKNIVVALAIIATMLALSRFDEIRSFAKSDWLRLALIGLIGGSIPFLLFFWGLQHTGAAQAAFVHKSMFIWVAIAAFVFLKEKLDKTYIIGAALLIAANLLLLALETFTLDAGSIAIFGATLLWSAEIALSKHTLKHLSSRTVAAGRMGFGSVFIAIYLVATNQFIFAYGSAQWGWVALTSLFLFAYVMTFYTALKLERASVVTPVLLLGSFITLLLNSMYTGSITPVQIIGSIIMIAGIYLVTQSYSAISVAKKKCV